MASSSPYTKTHFPISKLNSPIRPNPRRQGKSYTNFLCKSIFVAFFLILLPLFPSQAPDFINQTILTKFWELLHLLFIGIVVSYGLFSRRNVEMGVEENQPNFDNSQSYVNKMFPVPSIFEDGFENPCGSDEKRVTHGWNSQYFESEHVAMYSNSRTGTDEQCQPHFSMSQNGFEYPYVQYDQNNVMQVWNSQYFQGEPMVVVGQPNPGLEYKWGEPVIPMDSKPLGLPVRSLKKSRVRKTNSPELVSGSESGSSSKASRSSSRSRTEYFGDMGPTNLEKNFDEAAAASTSPIPWRSRSVRMGRRENVGAVDRPMHFRPLSVDETQFESLQSQSFGSTGSLLSQNSSVSSSHSISSELPNSSMEDLGRKRSVRGSSPSASPLPPTPTNGKASLKALHSRGYSIGSMSGKDVWRSSEDDFTVDRPMQFRPLSVDETQFESLQSQSFRSTGSLLSQTSSVSSSHSISSELPNSSMEDLGRKRSVRGSSPSASPLPPTPTNGKASLKALHSRGYSIGSVSGKDEWSSSEDDFKELNGKRREDPLSSKDSGLGSLKSNTELASLMKASLRGKSVRTVRANGLTADATKTQERGGNRINGKAEMPRENVEEVYMREDDMTNGGLDGLMKGTMASKRNLDGLCHVPKPTFAKYHKKERQEFFENVSMRSEEDSESEGQNVQVISDEDAVSGSFSDAGPDSSEVDKKAGEFIAKFKEQIRLQKTESIERSRSLHFGRNNFR